ncbi:MAG: alpha-1,2-fucosyltransferase, partial [Bacteroidota bacterium]|nr:alpha-1,2-fucosyltransferase [Bacteroidota bacterium]
RIGQKHSDLRLFVFSDDMKWVGENIRFDHPITFVDRGFDADAATDMHLMSLCKHNIIANSSFSWWAAWLNKNPGKIIVAPRRWFTSPDMSDNDLIPERWIKL